jgi:hypothetical protein
VVAVAIWYLGWTTRRPGYGFDMSRIVAQGFQKSWQPFSELGYYDRIAQEYGDCKSQYRATALKDLVVGAALPGGQRRSRSE